MHLALSSADVAGASLAIVPGDPARVGRIAATMDDPVHLATNREFTSFRASVGGHPVIICSTGVGGPSTSVAVEELAQLGIHTFLRVGTTGSIQPDLPIGHLVITQAAVRLDGASRHFAPREYPAASAFDCTRALVDAAEGLDAAHRVGVTASSDTFYPGQERYDTVAGQVTPTLRGSLEEWRRIGVLNYEMESSTLFTMCAVNGWRAGCVAGVIAQRTESEAIVDEDRVAETEQLAVRVVVDAANRLLD
ncbi:MAG: uridine phosphorylase [Actinomycetota bacterium]